MTQTTLSMSVEEAVTGRHCARAFLPREVPRETIEAILRGAARAPSGANTQPWKVHVVTGRARDRVCNAVLEAARRGEETPEYGYYPDDWFEPYQSRRRKVGYDLYGILGIRREDKRRRLEQHARNFMLFDAPVGLFFSMDRRLNRGSWLDMGMFIQNVMVLARGEGLETCPQAAWVRHGEILHRELGIPEGDVLICGMALGYEDTSAPENGLKTERADVHEFTTFLTE